MTWLHGTYRRYPAPSEDLIGPDDLEHVIRREQQLRLALPGGLDPTGRELRVRPRLPPEQLDLHREPRRPLLQVDGFYLGEFRFEPAEHLGGDVAVDRL